MTIFTRRRFFHIGLLLPVLVLLCVHARSVEAADIRATNAFPASDTTFYTTDSITFLGAVENMESVAVPEIGYADVVIDWDSDDTDLVNYNANPDDSENKLGALSSGGSIGINEIVSNPPLGTHQYRFFVDTINELAETDEDNNGSSWVSFTVIPVPVAPTITFSGAPNPVTLGGSATLTWTVTDATSCTGSNGSAGWSGAKNAGGGSQSVSPVVTTLYTISCTGAGGSATKSFTVDVVTPAPVITFNNSANPINSGSSVTLTWDTTNADTCTASDGWNGAKTTGNSEIVSPLTTTTYTLTCTGEGGTTIASQSITVNQLLPVISITASPLSVPSGGTTTVSWSVTNATFCIGSNGGGTFPTLNGWNTSKNPVSGTLAVSSVISRAYVLTCSNPTAGTTTAQVTVWVTGLPNLTSGIWANSQRINTSVGSTTSVLMANQANTLRAQVSNWGLSATGATFQDKFSALWGWTYSELIGYTNSVALGPGATNTPYDEISWTPSRAGHVELSFCVDLTNTIVEQNESDNCTYRSINVATSSLDYPNLHFSFQGVNNPNSYISTTTALGTTRTLAWSVSGATSCVGTSSPNADPAWNGPRNAAAGSHTFDVNPTIASINGYNNYALICTGSGSKVVMKTIRINVVTVQPTVTLTVATSTIVRGTATTITWTATDANTCTASSTPNDPNWTGSVSRNGGSQVTSDLNVSTLYKITCQSPSGSTIKNIQVDVQAPPPIITLTASFNPITPIDITTLGWTTTNAISCTGTSNPAEPDWDGARNIGFGAVTVQPDVTTTYTLTCTSSEGSVATISYTVSVASTPPLITFASSESIIIEGDNALLSWSVQGATHCEGTSIPSDSEWDNLDWDREGGYLTEAGTQVSPMVTTAYTLSCEGPWGSLSKKKEISVIEKSEITDFRVCVAGGGECRSAGQTLEVRPGTPLEVYWDSVDATSCSAIAGYRFTTAGAWNDGEDMDVMATPYADSTDTYTIACGSAAAGILTSDFVSITVHTGSTTPAIWITPKVVESSGGNIVVGWDANNGDQSVCSIKGGGLSTAVLTAGSETGSAPVTVLGRTSFVITCPSNNGLDTESATTTVELSPRIWGR